MKKVLVALLLALSLVGTALANPPARDERCGLLPVGSVARAICEAYYGTP